jgi:site-specific recombinase XerD
VVFQSVRRPRSPLTERAVHFIVKEAAERAGVNPAASIHWLRHAHASHAIDNGAPITLVSATLGHADLKTTSASTSSDASRHVGPVGRRPCSPGTRRWQDEVQEDRLADFVWGSE